METKAVARAILGLALGTSWACDDAAKGSVEGVSSSSVEAPQSATGPGPRGSSAGTSRAPAADGRAGADAAAGPVHYAPLHPAETQEQLLALIARPAVADKNTRRRREALLQAAVGPGSFGKMNQGNPEIARHEISRVRCLEGLQGIELQTVQQREICQGHPRMVPIYTDGDPQSAKACIDVFEFPNQPCELPFVWASATQARKVCRALGKRLCTQQEWVDACGADPSGGPRTKYAYGNKLDLTICNTNRPARDYHPGKCDPSTIRTTWETCGTHTAPAGSFPRCRSRLGVFDQHGNVAEAMTRWDPGDKKTYSQLKGSAFFYVDVHRTDDGPRNKDDYPDHCAHDPRWHVQLMTRAWHVNYHLGFRCCLSLR